MRFSCDDVCAAARSGKFQPPWQNCDPAQEILLEIVHDDRVDPGGGQLASHQAVKILKPQDCYNHFGRHHR